MSKEAPSLERREVPQSVPQLVVLDFDRTLINPNRVMERFRAVARTFGISSNRIEQEQQKVENQKKSFEPISFLKEVLSPDQMEKFKERFINIGGPPLLYDDVPGFLDMLDREAMPYVILTTAASKEWQELKLEVCGFKEKRVKIIDTKEKGKEIKTWQKAQDRYQFSDRIGDITAKSICFIDDTEVCLEGLPKENCTAYLLKRLDAKEEVSDEFKTRHPEIPTIKGLEGFYTHNKKLVYALAA